ncbi:MAG: UDP-3-O-acyl-N-acetylglucosamine deacetylase [Marinilabiliaceae bacterium]|nr:UDP-3-O-acyl-N-acetylglucosamine deacetylase [Marinilabiliaceae bacterium]
MEKQTTIKASASFKGKGLHTGVVVNLTICPAKPGTGYLFQRIDLEGEPMFAADARNVSFTQRGTVLSAGEGRENVTVSTIEHLMSALRGRRIDNCLIKLDGPEVPILDGSALPFIEAIDCVGIEQQDAEREYMVITEKVVYEEPEKGIRIIGLPEEYFAAQVNISFNGSRCLANQYALIESLDEYEEVYDCRTFVFLHEVAFLLQQGLIKGGDLDNAIVFVEKDLSTDDRAQITQLMGRELTIHPSGVLNDRDLKYPNEAARHKLLDLIGDLALVGKPIKGRFIATRSGHGSNAQFARMLIAKYGF